MSSRADWQIIVLHSPYDNMYDSTVQNLFSKTMDLKIRGYLMEYSYGVMPVDTTDFISTHLLICEKENDHWNPIAGYKSVPYSKCITHNVEFSPITLARASGSAECLNEVHSWVSESDKLGIDISYDCSWTVAPHIRRDRKNIRVLLEFIMMLSVNYHRDYSIPDWTTTGILRLETHDFFLQMGLEPFGKFNRIPHFGFHNEEVVFLRWKQASDTALLYAQKHKDFWDNRLEIGNKPVLV